MMSTLPQALSAHKNKTFATLLAAFGGALGLHRFYLYGWQDRAAWLHAASIIPSGVLLTLFPGHTFFDMLPLMLSALAGVLTALVYGLSADEKWDARHNPASGRQSASGWPLALLLVFTFGAGAIATIALLARSFDLLWTGGAYG
ncbi:NINE protein [Massilia sp. W12]|uniref:NINE protein n=1 Tax=Massilia sp. W12 TaxID=3126507 RepID=UPI0030D1BBEC